MIQPNSLLLINQIDGVTQLRNTRRVAWVILSGLIIAIIFDTYLAWQSGLWQFWSVLALTGCYTGTVYFSLALLQRNRVNLAAYLLIFGLQASLLIFTALVAKLGVWSGLAVVVLTVGIAGQILSQKQNSWVIAESFIIGVIIMVADLFLPEYRFVSPELGASMVVALSVVGLIVTVVVLRQLGNYSLQTKLMLAFVLVTTVALTTVAYLAAYTTRQELTTRAGREVRNYADAQAQILGESLARQIDALQILAQNKPLQAALQKSNQGEGTDFKAIEAEMVALDQAWQTAADSDPLILERVNNPVAEQLREYQAALPEHLELFVTDRSGALVAATNRTSDYYQADENWWRATFLAGRGDIYLGQPELAESNGQVRLIIAVPVYVHTTHEIIGVLRTTYNLADLSKILASIKLGETGRADLLLSSSQIIKSEAPDQIQAVDPIELAPLLAKYAPYVEFPFEDHPSFVSVAPVIDLKGSPAISDLRWRLVVHQQRDEALAAVILQERNSQLLGVLVAGVAIFAAAGVAQLLAKPISRLTHVVRQVATGDLTIHAPVTTNDEIGILATAFNSMTDQLRHTVTTLDEQVSARTQQLQTVVAISQQLTGILELKDLLQQVVILTKETFNYYHVHIYLLDAAKETLNLAEGYGEPGARMKEQGHQIKLAAPKSLVARAARHGNIVTTENVGLDPDWLPNPLLPHTHAEMAVPIALGAEIVGVLDVQSENVGGLTVYDEVAMQALANQVAVAVRNARLFSQTQQALQEAHQLQELYTSQAWEHFRTVRNMTEYEVRQPNLAPLNELDLPEALAALQQAQTVVLGAPLADRTIKPALARPSALATPLKLRNQVIGVLGLHDDNPQRRWSEDEIALIEAVSEQMTLALENARLFEDTQRSAWRDQMVSEATAKVWSAAQMEEVLKAAVAQLGDKLGASEVVIRLGTEAELVQE